MIVQELASEWLELEEQEEQMQEERLEGGRR